MWNIDGQQKKIPVCPASKQSYNAEKEGKKLSNEEQIKCGEKADGKAKKTCNLCTKNEYMLFYAHGTPSKSSAQGMMDDVRDTNFMEGISYQLKLTKEGDNARKGGEGAQARGQAEGTQGQGVQSVRVRNNAKDGMEAEAEENYQLTNVVSQDFDTNQEKMKGLRKDTIALRSKGKVYQAERGDMGPNGQVINMHADLAEAYDLLDAVDLEDGFIDANGEFVDRVFDSSETSYQLRPPTAREVEVANKTSRTLGAVGKNAVVPKYVSENTDKGDTILDFGAGKDAGHANALSKQGFNVTAYDFGNNVKEGIHDPNALAKKYDVVYASNVLNVQSSRNMLNNTLNEIAGSVKANGRAVVNLPASPRKMKSLDANMIERGLNQRFSSVERVGGTASVPIFEASFPKQDVSYQLKNLEAVRKKALSMPRTISDKSAKRQALRKQVIDKVYGEGAKTKTREAHLVIGLPASGKNHFVADPLAENTGSLMIDSDIIKAELPEYDNGIGAGAVHDEASQLILPEIFYKALTAGDNVVIPRTAKRLDVMQEMIEKLQAFDYKVHIYHTDLPANKAVQRVWDRYLETGRFVDPAFVEAIGDQAKQNYQILKSHKGVSEYAEFSTDVERGQEAILTEASNIEGLRSRGLGGPELEQSIGQSNSLQEANYQLKPSQQGKGEIEPLDNELKNYKDAKALSESIVKSKWTGFNAIQKNISVDSFPAYNYKETKKDLGRTIDVPIEVIYDTETNSIDLVDGQHRLSQAKRNGLKTIKANISYVFGGKDLLENPNDYWSAQQGKGEIESVADISKKYPFGSGEWTKAMTDRIIKKLDSGMEIDGSDEAFIETQLEHNERVGVEELSKKWQKYNMKEQGKGEISYQINESEKPPDQAVNLERLKIEREAKEKLKKGAEVVGDEIENQTGEKLSNEEVIEKAKEAEVLKKGVSREQTLAFEASLLKTRQHLARLSQEEKLTKEFLETLKIVANTGTDVARTLQSFNIDALPEYANIKTKMIKDLLKLGLDVDEILEAGKDVDWTDQKQVTDFYRKFIKPTKNEIINEFAYINILSSPKTHVVNTFSNLIQYAGLNPITKLYTTGVDVIASKMTGKQRESYLSEVPAFYRASINAFPKAVKALSDAMKGKAIIERPDVKHIQTKSKFVDYATFGIGKYVPRALEGMDVFFRTLIEAGEMESLAERHAQQTGGAEITAKEQLAMEKEARKRAEYYVFRQKPDTKNKSGQGDLLSTIDKGTQWIQKGRLELPGLKWFVRFVQTPMNILKQGVEYSPLGIATVKGASNKSEQIAKSLIGSTIFAGSYALAMAGRTTWGLPKNKKDREEFYASGRVPYSVLIGDKWVSYSKLGPIAYPMAMASALHYYSVESPDALSDSNMQKAYDALTGIMGFFSDQSYVQGLGDIVGAFEGNQYKINRAISSVPVQLIPLSSLQRWVNSLIDPMYRDKEKGLSAEAILDNLQSAIIGASQFIDPKIDPIGREVKREDVKKNALSPVRISTSKPKEELRYQIGQKMSRDMNKIDADMDKRMEDKMRKRKK